MAQKKLNETRVQLYKATPLKLQLVDELINLIKTIPNRFDVEMTSITFKEKELVLGDNMAVKTIEIDPQEIGGVLVHWYPNFNISTKNDPFCSVYILTVKEIKKLIKTLQKVKDYYLEHSKT